MRVFSGQRAFLVQRFSALVLLAFVAAAALRLTLGSPVTLAQWQAWAAQPFAAAVLALLAAALFAHAWVGLRDVVLDYVKPLVLRLAVLAFAAAGLVLLAAWTAFILVSHAL
jgi:succinate dehydrogenase / fumarate reductase, membrane anchor subunit